MLEFEFLEKLSLVLSKNWQRSFIGFFSVSFEKMCNKKALSNIAGRQFQPHLMKKDSLQEICHSLEASVRVVREASPVLAIASELVQQQERIQVTQLWPAYRPSHSCPFQIEIIIENQSWSIQLKLYLCPRSAICFPPPEQFVSSYVGSWSNKISFEYTSLCVSTLITY